MVTESGVGAPTPTNGEVQVVDGLDGPLHVDVREERLAGALVGHDAGHRQQGEAAAQRARDAAAELGGVHLRLRLSQAADDLDELHVREALRGEGDGHVAQRAAPGEADRAAGLQGAHQVAGRTLPTARLTASCESPGCDSTTSASCRPKRSSRRPSRSRYSESGETTLIWTMPRSRAWAMRRETLERDSPRRSLMASWLRPSS